MNKSIFSFVLMLGLCSCKYGKLAETEDDLVKNHTVQVSIVKDSLITSDHVSEGFLVRYENGNIEHIYRTDPGVEGDHAGNNSYISSRVSKDKGISWLEPKILYRSDYDDRNIHGGKLADESVIIFFRRYDSEAQNDNKPQGIGFLKYTESKDISEPNWINTSLLGGAGTDSINWVPGRGYMISLNGVRDSNIELLFSSDGDNWPTDFEYLYYEDEISIKMNESSFTYLKDGIIIGLIRNLSGNNYYQTISFDYGYNWTYPILSNIGSTYNVVGPHSFFDEESELFIVLASNRKKPYGEQGIDVYATSFKDLLNNDFNHTYVSTVRNKISQSMYFYGYPSSVKVADDEYLVVFTDRKIDELQTEFSNFYQFTIRIVNDELDI